MAFSGEGVRFPFAPPSPLLPHPTERGQGRQEEGGGGGPEGEGVWSCTARYGSGEGIPYSAGLCLLFSFPFFSAMHLLSSSLTLRGVPSIPAPAYSLLPDAIA